MLGPLGGSLGSLAAAAGPAGVAFAAAEGATKLMKGAFDTAREAVQTFGLTMRDLANNDALGALYHLQDAVTSAASAIPVSGEAFAAALRLGQAPLREFTATFDAYLQQARKLSSYSPELAASTAQAEITSILADVREAQQLGPELGRLQDAQTELNDTVRELLLPLRESVVTTLADAAETVVEFIHENRLRIEQIVAILAALPDAIREAIKLNNPAPVIRQALLDAANREARRQREEREGRDPTAGLLDDVMRNLFLPDRSDVPPAPNPDAPDIPNGGF